MHIEKLKAQLALLRRARFGRSSEKLDRDIEQLDLLIGDLEEGRAESGERTEAARPAASPSPRREPSQPVSRALPMELTCLSLLARENEGTHEVQQKERPR
jgi:transposase